MLTTFLLFASLEADLSPPLWRSERVDRRWPLAGTTPQNRLVFCFKTTPFIWGNFGSPTWFFSVLLATSSILDWMSSLSFNQSILGCIKLSRLWRVTAGAHDDPSVVPAQDHDFEKISFPWNNRLIFSTLLEQGAAEPGNHHHYPVVFVRKCMV